MNDAFKLLGIEPLSVAMLLYPGFTMLDLIGPQAVLSWAGPTHLVAKTMAPVLSDSGPQLVPTCTLADCPPDLDVLFVPGGFGTHAAMQDPELLEFLADRGARAGHVTSVCSGALLLGAAGLLRGYRSTTHWAVHDALAEFGAESVKQRVVVDRNRISGGGVTAGIDFGLVVLAELRGEDTARLVANLRMSGRPPTGGCPTNEDISSVSSGGSPTTLAIRRTQGSPRRTGDAVQSGSRSSRRA